MHRESLPNGERFTVSAAGPALLVRSEVWASGWTAIVDGRTGVSSVERTDCALQGVRLEAGVHSVDFVYDPWPYELGWRLSAFTAGALILYAVWLILRGRRA